MYHEQFYFKTNPRARINRYELWRKIARDKLSSKAQLRLVWIIFYYTVSKKNAACTAKHFCIQRSVFYYWLSCFNETRLKTLEDRSSKPKNPRKWVPDPRVLKRMILLRKEFIHWSKIKLSVVYENSVMARKSLPGSSKGLLRSSDFILPEKARFTLEM